MSDVFLQQAFGLAARGWRVFPCESRGKKPLIAEWQNHASCDPAEIQALWLRNPTANIAIATGSGSGIFVLDVDGQQGSDALLRWHAGGLQISDTLRVQTGRGTHLYFSWPTSTVVRNSASKLAPGLDVRGDGGYVIAPPSVHETGHVYTFSNPDITPCCAPEWLLHRIAQPQQGICLSPWEGDGTIPPRQPQ
jgi:hypothetical protein